MFWQGFRVRAFGALFALASGFAFAQEGTVEGTTSTFQPNITAEHFSVGGGLSFTQTVFTPSLSTTRLSISVPVEYFVIDYLALGATSSFTYSSDQAGNSLAGIWLGPSVSYHFLQLGQLSFRGGLAWRWNVAPITDLKQGIVSLGAYYFITRSVGFGPVFSYARLMEDNFLTAISSYDMTLRFSVFL